MLFNCVIVAIHFDSDPQIKDSYRMRLVRGRRGLRGRLSSLSDEASGWIVAALSGCLTACVAFLVDVTEAVVSDYKYGFCKHNPLLSREACCEGKSPLLQMQGSSPALEVDCPDFKLWSHSYFPSFAIYVGFALAFGLISSAVTMLTRTSLPAAASESGASIVNGDGPERKATGKPMYLAAGSGIPEIKTILSGFVIPHYLDFKVLVVKAVGAVFAVATGMCLGKEGP